jgi:hypothetical protein
MRTKLIVHPGATLAEIRFYRCFSGANFDVFNYSSPDQRREQPRNTLTRTEFLRARSGVVQCLDVTRDRIAVLDEEINLL